MSLCAIYISNHICNRKLKSLNSLPLNENKIKIKIKNQHRIYRFGIKIIKYM